MKKLFKLTLAAIGCIGLIALTPCAQAQVSIPLKIYPLTNSLSGTTNYLSVTNGGVQLATTATYIVQTQPFQIWRGRGFALNFGAYNTNAAATNGTLNYVMRYGSVHSQITNWSQYTSATFSLSGTTETNYFLLVPPTTVDNVSLGQLYSLTANSTNGVFIDPTNSYIGVYP